MRKRFMNGQRMKIIFALALFNFLFLGTEYLFDNMIAYTTDANGVVVAQSYVLGASVGGFLLFAVIRRLLKVRIQYLLAFVASVGSIICIFVIQQHASYSAVLIAGIAVFIILGVAGSMVHYMAAVVLNCDRFLAKTVGVAYALGLLLQFLNNNLVNQDMAESIILSIFLMIFAILLVAMHQDELQTSAGLIHSEEKQQFIIKKPLVAAGILAICVVLMTCIFATLDNVVTLVHAGGSVDIGQWPRLILAISGLLAGVLFDIKDRRYMNIMMYSVTVLSTICVVVIEFGGPFLIGLIVFYISAGFFVVFFSTGFMELSHYMRVPELWAGIGRALNNLCAGLIGTVSLALIESENGILICSVALILFVLISITVFGYNMQFERKAEVYNADVDRNKEEEERFERFAKEFALTERERDVLKILLVSDENIQEIASSLYISRAALYRHITSLNEKTQTKSRVGLLQFYFNWKE